MMRFKKRYNAREDVKGKSVKPNMEINGVNEGGFREVNGGQRRLMNLSSCVSKPVEKQSWQNFLVGSHLSQNQVPHAAIRYYY